MKKISYFFRFPKVEDYYYSKHLVYCSLKFRLWVQIELNTKSKWGYIYIIKQMPTLNVSLHKYGLKNTHNLLNAQRR